MNKDPITGFDGPFEWSISNNERTYLDRQQIILNIYPRDNSNYFTTTFSTGQVTSRISPGKSAEKITEGFPWVASVLHSRSLDDITLLLDAYSFGKGVEAAGIRQLSVGVKVLKKYAEKRSIETPMVSIVGRNFMNRQEGTNNYMYKSFSVSFTFNY